MGEIEKERERERVLYSSFVEKFGNVILDHCIAHALVLYATNNEAFVPERESDT